MFPIHPDCVICAVEFADEIALARLLAAVQESAAMAGFHRELAARPQTPQRRRIPRYGVAGSTRTRYSIGGLR